MKYQLNKNVIAFVPLILIVLVSLYANTSPSIVRAQGCYNAQGIQVFCGDPGGSANPPESSDGSLSQVKDFNGLATRIASIGDVIVYLLTGLALVYIVYATVQYFIKGKEGEGRGAAGMQILWGIIGLAIILSLWGLVNILLQTFGTTTTNAPTGSLPQANFLSNSTNNTSF